MTRSNSQLFILVFLGILTAFGPFVTDMYLPTLPAMTDYFHTTSSQVQLGLSKLSVSLLLRQFLLSLLLIQGFTPFYKSPDSCLPLSFLPVGNGDKPVYGFCDFLILFLSDTSIHGRCPPANLLR